jgi:hypothetical protein
MSSTDGYDEFETPRRRPTVRAAILAATVVVLVAGAGVAFALNRSSNGRLDTLAVQYGFAEPGASVTAAQRCSAAMMRDYATGTPQEKAGIGPRAMKQLMPRVCALAVQRGLVGHDSTMSYDAGYSTMQEVLGGMGFAKIQLLVFTELAVRYGLAPNAQAVTGWDRCVGMGYSGYDAAATPDRTALPARPAFRQMARNICTAAVAQHLIAANGTILRADYTRLMQAEMSTA